MKISEHYLLGMDMGTTNIKAIIMDEKGQVLASATRPNTLIFPGPNMVEQDPHIWWNNTIEILKEITTKVGSMIVERIKGICVSSQTVTMLPLDKDGNHLCNAMIWMDHRSNAQLQHILNTIGYDKFVAIVGGQPDVAFLPNKILWLKENKPEIFNKTHRILQASSYINYKLTGQMTMDLDQATRSQCLNISTLTWSEDISKAIGIDLNTILPLPVPVDHIIGTVTSSAAQETGLISGIPVVAGASDAMASMYATGLSRLSEAGESSGTTSLVFVGHHKSSAPHLPIVTKPCPIPGMPYVFDAPINTSGASIQWFLDTFCKEEKDKANQLGINVYEYLNTIANQIPAGSNGLLYFPYLLGERAPLWNTHAKGMFIGMSLDTKREDMIRSVFEGTAFALRHVMDTIKDAGGTSNCLRITGGGSKSHTWSKIKASMLHMPVYILDEKSGDVPFGDALIVGQAVGVFSDLTKSINQLIQVKEIIEPNHQWEEIYDQIYPFYLNMYKHLDEDLKHYKTVIDSIKRS